MPTFFQKLGEQTVDEPRGRVQSVESYFIIPSDLRTQLTMYVRTRPVDQYKEREKFWED